MTTNQIRFAAFRLELENQRLIGPDGEIPLRPKAFAVLRFLAEHPDQLVTKAALLDACWPSVSVGDAVLKGCIREVREALADNAAAPSIIKTCNRLGYRFITTVERPTVESIAPPLATASSTNGRPWATGSLLPVPPQLVQREPELSRLAARFERAKAGVVQTVLIKGEAGAGKTALLEAFLHALQRDGAPLVARGQCIEQHGSGESYLPVFAALSDLSSRLGKERLTKLLLKHAPSWLLQLPALVSGISSDHLQREALGAGRDRMLREGVDALLALSQEQCLLLMLEDLHWADAATIEFVTYLAQIRMSARVLVLTSCRDGDSSGSSALSQVFGLPARGLAELIVLAPLTTAAVETLMGQRLRLLSPDLLHPLAHAVQKRTEGNPLFVTALIEEFDADSFRQVSSNGFFAEPMLRQIERFVPPSIEVLIEQSISCLPPESQLLLEATSVVGENAAVSAVAAALGLPVPEVETRLERVSRQQNFLKSAGLRHWPDGSVCTQYHFVHILYCDVLYQRIGPARRLGYHVAIGKHLADATSTAPSSSAAAIAYHFEHGHDFPAAIRFLFVLAWHEAMHLGDRSARRYLDHALMLTERLSGGARITSELCTLERRALLASRLGDLQAAYADFERLIRLAEETDRSEWRARGFAGLAMLLTWMEPLRALSLSEQAMAIAERQDNKSQKILMRGLAGFLRCLLGAEWRSADATSCLDALQAASPSDDPPLWNVCSQGVQILAMQGDYEASLVTAQKGCRLALNENDLNEYLSLRYFASGALFFLGRFGDALRSLTDARNIAERNRDVGWMVMLGVGQACVEVQCFAFTDAIGRSQQALEFARQSPVRLAPLELMCHSITALSLIGQGRLAEASSALLHLQPNGPLSFNIRLTVLLAKIELALAQGDDAAATVAAQKLLELTEPAGEPTGIVWARRTLAMVAGRQQRWNEAESELARAASVLVEKAAPIAAWRLYQSAVEIYAMQGRSTDVDRARRQCVASLTRIADSLDGWDALKRTFFAHPATLAIVM